MPLSKDIIEVAKIKAREHLIDFEILTNPKYRPNWHHDETATILESIANGSFISQGFKILILEVPPKSKANSVDTVKVSKQLLIFPPGILENILTKRLSHLLIQLN